MPDIAHAILKDLGLDSWPPFIKDKLYWLAMIAGIVVWFTLWLTVAPTFSVQNRSITRLMLLSVIYYPLLEEILFRGIVQGWLSKKSWGTKKLFFFSVANWLASLLFVAAHFWYQPVLWALTIIVPSLVYGFFRDRYNNTYPAITLHAYYNAGFVLLNIFAL